MEMIEASQVMKRVAGFLTSVTVVAAENIVEAFSAIYRPDLVSPLLFPCLPFI